MSTQPTSRPPLPAIAVGGIVAAALLFAGRRALASSRAPRFPADGGRATLDRLFKAITAQESGGDSRIVNKDTGALGLAQVMPANVGPWTREAARAGVLDREYTPAEFRERRDVQERVVRFKLAQYFNEGWSRYGQNAENAVRYAAAKWYSGNGDLFLDERPQVSNGTSYPSIATYARQVFERFRVA